MVTKGASGVSAGPPRVGGVAAIVFSQRAPFFEFGEAEEVLRKRRSSRPAQPSPKPSQILPRKGSWAGSAGTPQRLRRVAVEAGLDAGGGGGDAVVGAVADAGGDDDEGGAGDEDAELARVAVGGFEVEDRLDEFVGGGAHVEGAQVGGADGDLEPFAFLGEVVGELCSGERPGG